jgi:hypothetical protein
VSDDEDELDRSEDVREDVESCLLLLELFRMDRFVGLLMSK